MKPSDAAKEILALAEESLRLGGRGMSDELRAFVDKLSTSPGLKAVRKSTRSGNGESSGRAPRVGTRPKRDTEAEMSKTIEELAERLRKAFNSDDTFEVVLNDPKLKALSKANVVTLYKTVFDEARPLTSAMTKPEMFNAIRRERIKRVRGGYTG